RVDGQNVLGVYEATKAALEHCRSGKGPFFLEALTYRFRGHSMGDPERYREPEEVARWREDDPIGRLQKLALDRGVARQKDFEQLDAAVEMEVAEAVRFAEESPDPTWEIIQQHVYVNP
ncbi:MAG: pyruvate dehydrogenase (acetyl-transferring) E1 component subunit alpha, partial [Chloroflexota bacterium]